MTNTPSPTEAKTAKNLKQLLPGSLSSRHCFHFDSEQNAYISSRIGKPHLEKIVEIIKETVPDTSFSIADAGFDEYCPPANAMRQLGTLSISKESAEAPELQSKLAEIQGRVKDSHPKFLNLCGSFPCDAPSIGI